MLEADGDLTEISQAITQALRPTQPLTRQHVAIAARSTVLSPDPAATQEDESPEMVMEVETQESQDPESPAASKPRAPRKLPRPNVLADVDLTSGEMPFEKFAEEKGKPSAHLKRYLLIAYWFKTFRNVDAITPNHVFTCYKKVSWTTQARDFAQPLRDLARNGNGDMKEGSFAINHIGEGVVEKMTAEE
jgi:hypothetical protein